MFMRILFKVTSIFPRDILPRHANTLSLGLSLSTCRNMMALLLEDTNKFSHKGNSISSDWCVRWAFARWGYLFARSLYSRYWPNQLCNCRLSWRLSPGTHLSLLPVSPKHTQNYTKLTSRLRCWLPKGTCQKFNSFYRNKKSDVL